MVPLINEQCHHCKTDALLHEELEMVFVTVATDPMSGNDQVFAAMFALNRGKHGRQVNRGSAASTAPIPCGLCAEL